MYVEMLTVCICYLWILLVVEIKHCNIDNQYKVYTHKNVTLVVCALVYDVLEHGNQCLKNV